MKAMVAAVILASLTGVTGYYIGATADRPVLELSLQASLDSEYLFSSESFSEVERITSMMDALAERYVEQAQRLLVDDYLMRTRKGLPDRQDSDDRLLAAVRLLEEGFGGFRGSRQELVLLPTLLYGLKRQGSYDRWLDTYLDVLTRHPTAARVLALYDEALKVAHSVGREDDVAHAMMRLAWARFDPSHLNPIESNSSAARVWSQWGRS